MPIDSLPEPDYSFSQDYTTMRAVNLPIRYIDPQFGTVKWGDQEAIKVYTNTQDTIQFFPDFFNTNPAGYSATDFVDNYRYFFDFGDGTISSDLTASHFYTTPGTYKVTLVAVDSASNFYRSTSFATVCAVNVIPDSIFMSYKNGATTNQPANSALASKFQNPIFVTRFNSYQTFPSVSANGYTIRLSVSGNQSNIMKSKEYYSDSNAHLKKFAAFAQEIDGNLTIVDTVSTTTTKIYGTRQKVSASLPDYFLSTQETVGSIFLGTSGTGEFFYYED